ncbi:MAG TPA: glucose-6-phosphate dehydrogenase assembly protein OpcA [Actinomycetales bacterium]|nr:glucose-6-phosphate dehydrogenase assembly protein OpcA [Actinomycetales bacterium]
MRIHLKQTTSSKIAAELVRVREEGGVVALGRVLTLIVMAHGQDHAENAIAATNEASREHPSRVIVVDTNPPPLPDGGSPDSLDAEIRVGADAGASEVVLLRPRGRAGAELDTLVSPLLLPDTPIVAVWVGTTPENPSGEPVGRMASRRITDIIGAGRARESLRHLAANYRAGDTDLAWARITLWRALLASVLDGKTDRVRSVVIEGDLSRPSVDLMAGWLRATLGVPASTLHSDAPHIESIRVDLGEEELFIHRPQGATSATIHWTGHRVQTTSLPVRQVSDCLMEDLRRLDADEVYARALAAAVQGGA